MPLSWSGRLANWDSNNQILVFGEKEKIAVPVEKTSQSGTKDQKTEPTHGNEFEPRSHCWKDSHLITINLYVMLIHEGVCRFNPKFKYMTFMYQHHIDLYPSSTGLIELHKKQPPVSLIAQLVALQRHRRDLGSSPVEAWIFKPFSLLKSRVKLNCKDHTLQTSLLSLLHHSPSLSAQLQCTVKAPCRFLTICVS